jgi:ABC-type antimicrobial peptide transport system permease subunit
LGEGFRLAAIGVVAGLAITALGGRAMASLLYGVTQTHVPTLLLAGGVMVAIAVLASLGPAERAARIAPANALRSE